MKRGFLNSTGKSKNSKTPAKSIVAAGKDNIDSVASLAPKAVEKTAESRDTAIRMPPSKEIPFALNIDVNIPRTADEALKALSRMGIKKLPDMSMRTCSVKDPGMNRSPFVCTWLTYTDLMTAFPLEYDWGPLDVETPLPRPYRIAASPGAGLGMFATREIAMGEAILNERAVVLVPALIIGAQQLGMNDGLEFMLSVLPEDIQQRVNALSVCKIAPGENELFARVMTNSLKCNFPQSKALPTYAGVFPDISRCNHSCGPNAVWKFDSRTLCTELRATRMIPTGAEITISYVPVLDTRASRQEELTSGYAFTCACAHCTLSTNKTDQSDARRRRIGATLSSAPQMWRLMMDDSTGNLWRKMVDGLKRALSCLEPEGLDSLRGEFDRYLAAAYAAIGDEPNFKKWAESAVSTERLLSNDGYGYLSGRDWEAWLRDPTLIPCWKQRKVRQSERA